MVKVIFLKQNRAIFALESGLGLFIRYFYMDCNLIWIYDLIQEATAIDFKVTKVRLKFIQ